MLRLSFNRSRAECVGILLKIKRMLQGITWDGLRYVLGLVIVLGHRIVPRKGTSSESGTSVHKIVIGEMKRASINIGIGLVLERSLKVLLH